MVGRPGRGGATCTAARSRSCIWPSAAAPSGRVAPSCRLAEPGRRWRRPPEAGASGWYSQRVSFWGAEERVLPRPAWPPAGPGRGLPTANPHRPCSFCCRVVKRGLPSADDIRQAREKRLHISAGFVDYPIAAPGLEQGWQRQLFPGKSVWWRRTDRPRPAAGREAGRLTLRSLIPRRYEKDATPRRGPSWRREFFDPPGVDSRSIVWLLPAGH